MYREVMAVCMCLCNEVLYGVGWEHCEVLAVMAGWCDVDWALSVRWVVVSMPWV